MHYHTRPAATRAADDSTHSIFSITEIADTVRRAFGPGAAVAHSDVLGLYVQWDGRIAFFCDFDSLHTDCRARELAADVMGFTFDGEVA